MGNKQPSNDLITFSQGEFAHIDQQSSIDSFLFTPKEQQTNQWIDVTQQNVYYRIQYGKFHVYRNQITLQEVEKFKVVLKDKQQYNKFIDICKWRNNSQFIPKIERIIVLNQTQICVSQFQLNILMERIPLRLADLTDIPFPQNLYFLTAILKGYKYVFDSAYITKMFRVTQTMIGVNMEGEVKVWWSSNMSEMDTIMDDDKKQGFVSEQQFVRRVIDLVEENTDERDYPYPFRRYLKQRNIPINGDFTLIINQVYTYAKQMNVTIPKCSFSVRDILKRDSILDSNKMESQSSLLSNRFGFQSKNKGIESSNKEFESKNKHSGRQLKCSDEFNNNNKWLKHEKHPVGVVNYPHKSQTTNLHQKDKATINPTFTITNPISGNVNYQSPQFHYQEQHLNVNSSKQGQGQKYAIQKLGQNIIQLTNTQPLHNIQKYYPEQQQYHNTPSSLLPPNYADDISHQQQHHARFVVGNNTPPRVQFNKNSYMSNQFHGWNNYKQPDIEINKNLQYIQQPYAINNYSATGKQIVSNPITRFNSAQLQNQSSYLDLNHHNTEYLPFQKSTPTFSQTIKPNFSYPSIYTNTNNNNINTQSETQSYFDRKQIYTKQKPQFMMPRGVEVDSNRPQGQKVINVSEQLNGKLRYYARKDSQQTLDPQIASDLAKYLTQY